MTFGGCGYIPINSIYEYCRNCEIEGLAKDTLVYCVTAMDRFYMQFMSEKREKEIKDKEKESNKNKHKRMR